MIRVRCPHCAKLLGVVDNKAGQTVPCPICKQLVSVPADTKPDTVVPVPSRTAPPGPGKLTSAPPQKPAVDNLEVVDDEPVLDLDDAHMVQGPADRDEEDTAARPRKKKKKKPAGGSAGANKEIISGILMMVGAVVWFFGALIFLDRIFFYPPILFALGIGAVARGMTNDG